MTGNFKKLIICLLSLVCTGYSQDGSKVKIPIKRSYQVPVAVVNNPAGFQYYTTGPLYTAAIPTVFLQNQVSLPAAPIAKIVLPPSSEPKPLQEFQETSTPVYPNLKPNSIPVHYYNPKFRSYVVTSKRPTSYINSLYGHPIRMKPLSAVPTPTQKVSSLSIQPSVDLSGQYSNEVPSSLYPSTVGPPVGSTYGPAKAVDFQHKARPSGQMVYHRMKGTPHRHPYYPPKKMRVYTHVHKDHVHNHYLPPKNSPPSYKPPTTSKYSGPAYLPPAVSTPPTTYVEARPMQENAPVYTYQTSSHVRFPDKVESSVQEQTDFPKSNNSPGDVTQAIIKNPGVINNYDASLPIHVPSKKPYQFEVNEILKNSDLHFVQENQDSANGGYVTTQNTAVVQKIPYHQNPLFFNQPLYTPISVNQPNVITAAANPLDVYGLSGVGAYQTNHITPEEDLGTSESLKIPVAVIRGAHNFDGQGVFGFTMKRQDETSVPKTKKTFTPSRRTSDWIPMSGNGTPLVVDDNNPEQQSSSETPADSIDYYASDNQQPKTDIKTIRQPVGDIISGKIPEEFSPKELTASSDQDVVIGKIPFGRSSSSERDRRKGSVIDVYPASGSGISKIGDSSNHVVSSVIKFS